MRIFVALDLDDDIRQRIQTFMDGVQNFSPGARWVNATALHVTLQFIFYSPILKTLPSLPTHVSH